jgi:hypothetical protein
MITLPAALISVFQQGGVTIETDATAAVTAIAVDYRTKILTMTIQQGTTTGQAFAPGQYPSQYSLVVNMVTGVWFVNGSSLSGTFNGASISAISAIFLPLRNSGEAFVIQIALFPAATETNWTQI